MTIDNSQASDISPYDQCYADYFKPDNYPVLKSIQDVKPFLNHVLIDSANVSDCFIDASSVERDDAYGNMLNKIQERILASPLYLDGMRPRVKARFLDQVKDYFDSRWETGWTSRISIEFFSLFFGAASISMLARYLVKTGHPVAAGFSFIAAGLLAYEGAKIFFPNPLMSLPEPLDFTKP